MIHTDGKPTICTITREQLDDIMNDPRPLAPDTGPHMTRETGGYEIACTFIPQLANAESAMITITQNGVLVDSKETLVEDAVAAWQHPAIWSDRYNAALSVKPDHAE